jgi:hypothetical protein
MSYFGRLGMMLLIFSNGTCVPWLRRRIRLAVEVDGMFDLAVLDLDRPGLDGITAASRLHERLHGGRPGRLGILGSVW